MKANPLSPSQVRTLTENPGLAEKVQIETKHIPSRDGYAIPTRIYSPKNTSAAKLPIYIFFHGGGFIYGTPTTDDAALSRIVAAMPIIIVNAVYRHAPQDVYPAAHNDADDTFDWVIANAGSLGGDLNKVVVGGLSAGANLAASVVLNKHKKGPKINGLLLGIPYLILNTEKFSADYHAQKEKASRVQCKNAPVLPMEVVDFFSKTFKGKYEGALPDVGLTTEEGLKDFPSTNFLIAGNDPLRDDGFMFAEKMQRAGYVPF
jgi:acetyl esterase/lipase